MSTFTDALRDSVTQIQAEAKAGVKDEICIAGRSFIFFDADKSSNIDRHLISLLTGIPLACDCINAQRKYVIVEEPYDAVSVYVNHVTILKFASRYLKLHGYKVMLPNIVVQAIPSNERSMLKVVIGLPMQKKSVQDFENLIRTVANLITIINKVSVNATFDYKCGFCDSESMFIYPNLCCKHFEALSKDSVQLLCDEDNVNVKELKLFKLSSYNYHDNLMKILGLHPFKVICQSTSKFIDFPRKHECLSCGADTFGALHYPITICDTCAKKVDWANFVVDFCNHVITEEEIAQNHGIKKYM